MSQAPFAPWQETLDFLQPLEGNQAAAGDVGRAPIVKDVFVSLPDELRTRAFTVARMTEASMMSEMLGALQTAADKGWTLWNFKENFAQIAPQASSWFAEQGRDWHLNLVFRNNIRQAQAVGAYAARQRVKQAFPYVEYIAGVNPRPAHAALDRKIFAVDDPFLLSHTPPWEHNCNCDLISRTAAQVGRVQEQDQEQPLEAQRVVAGNEGLERELARNRLPNPQTGAIHPVDLRPPSQKPGGDSYSFRPDRLNQVLDLSGYEPELRVRLAGQLGAYGYQLSADGLTAMPVGSATALKASTNPARRVGVPTAFKSRLAAFAGPSAGQQAPGRNLAGRASQWRHGPARGLSAVTGPGGRHEPDPHRPAPL